MTRCIVPALVAALLAVLAADAGATLTETPTCSLPPTADGALCEHGRSPNAIVAGPDGAVWLTLFGTDEIGRITPAGALTLLPIPGPAGGGPDGIALGPDGALWFTEDFGNRIGRVDTAGAFSFVDDPGARPSDIAAGPDGALWVSEAATHSLGRVTTAGALTHVALPAPAAGKIGPSLGQLVAGPDGRIWVTETQRDMIAAVTTAGTVTEYPVPKGTLSQEITKGPDGALWFTSYSHDVVGRMTTAGKLTLYSIAGSGPASITTGPDGALWVGEGRASGLLRITTSGAVTETPLLFAPTVNGITTGPDGAVWWTETGPNRVGRLTLGPVAPAPAPGPVPSGAIDVAPPARVQLATARPGADTVAVPLRATAPVRADLVLALAPRGSAVAAAQRSISRARPLVTARTSLRPGRATVHIRLPARARRTLARARRRHETLVVALRARGTDRRVTVVQGARRLR